MAKADDASSTIDWIWLREALKVAGPAVASERLAKKMLPEWIAAGKIPWSCVSWEGPTAEFLTFLEQVNSSLGKVRLNIACACHEGDPEFWRAPDLTIDWEENEAHDSALGGARASGIRLSRTHLLALLPAVPHGVPGKADEPSPEQRRKAGTKPKYDWDAIQAHCHRCFVENGYPSNVSEFCRDDLIPWCVQRYGEDGTPDMETLRPYITRWIDAWLRSLPPK
jgi:hypothetical protein